MTGSEEPTRPRIGRSYVKWPHAMAERVLSGELGMMAWLYLMASPATGTLRTSWGTLGDQLRVPGRRVEAVCRELKRKGYLRYEAQRGRRTPFELTLDEFPLPGDRYTDL